MIFLQRNKSASEDNSYDIVERIKRLEDAKHEQEERINKQDIKIDQQDIKIDKQDEKICELQTEVCVLVCA